MSMFFLVEGKSSEPKLYRRWIARCFPGLEEVSTVDKLAGQTFLIRSGGGYPNLIRTIRDAVRDVIRQEIFLQHFFVCLDAEEETYDSRYREVAEILQAESPAFPFTVIVQDCCLETWLLGNSSLFRPAPKSPDLKRFRSFYDVGVEDPEGLPKMPGFETRAQFHFRYLQRALQQYDLAYSKRNPGQAVLEAPYFEQLVQRHQKFDHLKSLGHLLICWRALGADL